MTANESRLDGADRLEALIRHRAGWQVDDLHVERNRRGLILRGHACTASARAFVQGEAARLSGLPIAENRIQVY